MSIAAFIESHHAVRIEEKSMEMALLTVQSTAVLLDDPVTRRSNCLCVCALLASPSMEDVDWNSFLLAAIKISIDPTLTDLTENPHRYFSE